MRVSLVFSALLVVWLQSATTTSSTITKQESPLKNPIDNLKGNVVSDDQSVQDEGLMSFMKQLFRGKGPQLLTTQQGKP